MESKKERLNEFLVEVFNEILKSEEYELKKSGSNLSISEIHVIEAVCQASRKGRDNSSAAIAKNLRITAGSLTTAVSKIEKKGYLERVRDSSDKRVVKIFPTESGLKVNEIHSAYHREMVHEITSILNDCETDILLKGLSKVEQYFKNGRKS